MSENILITVTDSGETIATQVNEAARGPAGSDANITNATVNAAIATSPETTRTSLGLGTAATSDILGNEIFQAYVDSSPLEVPIRCFMTNFSAYAGADYKPATITANSQYVQAHGLVFSPGGGISDNDQVFVVPNGFVVDRFENYPICMQREVPDYTWIIGVANLVNKALAGGYHTRNYFLCGLQAGLSPADIIGVHTNGSWTSPSYFGGACKLVIGDDLVSVLAPRQAVPEKIVLYFHGSGDDYLSHITSALAGTQELMVDVVPALLTAGMAIVAYNGGAIVDNCGNPQSWVATQVLVERISEIWPGVEIVVLAQSFGAPNGLRALTQISGITKGYFIYPVCDTDWAFSQGIFISRMNTAYSGSYTANSGGCNPIEFSQSSYTGKDMILVASASDTIVSKSANSDALATYVSGFATATVVTHTGNHGNISAFNAAAIVAFFES